jgi:hypothetical protein
MLIGTVLGIAGSLVILLIGMRIIPMWNGWCYVIRPMHPRGSEIFLEGDIQAVSRNDPTWRKNWKWILLQTDNWEPYYVYFLSEGICMRYGPPIKTKYVAVRIGPGDVRFFARGTGLLRKSLPLIRVVRDMVPMEQSELSEKLEEWHAVSATTWI